MRWKTHLKGTMMLWKLFVRTKRFYIEEPLKRIKSYASSSKMHYAQESRRYEYDIIVKIKKITNLRLTT